VLASCDALGTLRYGGRGGEQVFGRCLPDEWEPVADILYDALRNGLVHGYDAKLIVAGGSRIGFAIGWRGSSRHMQFTTRDRDVLYVDGPSLVHALRRVFDEVERELRGDPQLCDDYFTRDRKGRHRVVTVTTPNGGAKPQPEHVSSTHSPTPWRARQARRARFDRSPRGHRRGHHMASPDTPDTVTQGTELVFSVWNQGKMGAPGIGVDRQRPFL
jgi:hypothetical protein